MDSQNVVFIFSDQHNPSFTGCYGNQLTRTPNLDRLATEGIRFDNAFTPCPLCVPARAAMFAGKYAFELELYDNTRGWDGTPGGWSHYLKKQGIPFTTIGKLDFHPGADHGIAEEIFEKHRTQPWSEVKMPSWAGRHKEKIAADTDGFLPAKFTIPPESEDKGYFAEIAGTAPHNGVHPDITADLSSTAFAVEWLKNHRPRHEPWVLNINMWKPHSPWHPDKKRWDHYDNHIRYDELHEKYRDERAKHFAIRNNQLRVGIQHLTPEQIRRCHIGYHATIEFVDSNVGRILDTLDTHGLSGNTTVIYAADHGECVGAHGCFAKNVPYDDAMRVPLIVRRPGGPSKRASQSLVSLFDIFPTICSAVGLPLPDAMRGNSLFDSVDQNTAPYVFCECHEKKSVDMYAIRTLEHKYVETDDGSRMLFDMINDPHEMNDLAKAKAADTEAGKIMDDMRGVLHSVCDPERVTRQYRAKF